MERWSEVDVRLSKLSEKQLFFPPFLIKNAQIYTTIHSQYFEGKIYVLQAKIMGFDFYGHNLGWN